MTGRIVLITGATSGVGYATAKVLARSPGFHVIISGRSTIKLEQSLSSLQDTSPVSTISSLLMDVADPESIKQAVETFSGGHQHLDVLINNAAIGGQHPDLHTRLMMTLNTNVIGAALVSEAFRPYLMKSQDPRSIYVSSGAGSITKNSDSSMQKLDATFHTPDRIPYMEAYQISKAAMNMAAVRESALYGPKLKVFAMSPGFVVSNLRGTTEEQRSGWGMAGDPDVAGQTMCDIVNGKRDGDMGKLITKDGTCPW